MEFFGIMIITIIIIDGLYKLRPFNEPVCLNQGVYPARIFCKIKKMSDFYHPSTEAD